MYINADVIWMLFPYRPCGSRIDSLNPLNLVKYDDLWAKLPQGSSTGRIDKEEDIRLFTNQDM